MRTGKIHEQISLLAKSLNEGKKPFVAMLGEPKDYINRLYKDFNIAVKIIPHYTTRNYNITFEDTPPYRVWESGGEKQLTGYEFIKI